MNKETLDTRIVFFKKHKECDFFDDNDDPISEEVNIIIERYLLKDGKRRKTLRVQEMKLRLW